METLTSISRRDLLKAGGALVVSFSIGSLVPDLVGAQDPTGATSSKPLDPSDVDSFFAIHADGGITLYTGKVDIGTGLLRHAQRLHLRLEVRFAGDQRLELHAVDALHK